MAGGPPAAARSGSAAVHRRIRRWRMPQSQRRAGPRASRAASAALEWRDALARRRAKSTTDWRRSSGTAKSRKRRSGSTRA